MTPAIFTITVLVPFAVLCWAVIRFVERQINDE